MQPSLSGGELDPGLAGRVDLARYAVSLATCRNCIPKATGGAVRRPGTLFRREVKDSPQHTRLLPFVFSTETKYLIEAGNEYYRFYVGGAPLLSPTKAITNASQTNPVVLEVIAHGYTTGQTIYVAGIFGMIQLNGRYFTVNVVDADNIELVGIDGTGYTAYATQGTTALLVEVDTPYQTADLDAIRITQSADVLYQMQPLYQPRELRRLTASTFEMRKFDFRFGPFRQLNLEDAILMASSGVTGNVTVTCNKAVFNANMVGSLVYFEEKELRSVKPWEPLERNVGIGTYRRSDGKVYRCVSVPDLSGVTPGVPYYICGNTRPLHEFGRAFDGPGDTRTDGVNGYRVGVEWEFVHGGYGVVKVTGYNTDYSVPGVVVLRVPESCIGTAPSPTTTWTLSGDGVAKVFAVAGAVSATQSNYTVTIDGIPISSNPYAPPVTGGGGNGGGVNVRPGGGTHNAQ